MAWISREEPPEVDDDVWLGLNRLAGADSPATDRRYLFTNADFEAWIVDLGPSVSESTSGD